MTDTFDCACMVLHMSIPKVSRMEDTAFLQSPSNPFCLMIEKRLIRSRNLGGSANKKTRGNWWYDILCGQEMCLPTLDHLPPSRRSIKNESLDFIYQRTWTLVAIHHFIDSIVKIPTMLSNYQAEYARVSILIFFHRVPLNTIRPIQSQNFHTHHHLSNPG